VTFLSPLALGLFALAAPLLLLYFLKVRRRERSVSSLLLWEVAVRERQASTVFHRFQRDPLVILQLLGLLALSLALARPTATVVGRGARKVVVVLDTSASMKATDVGPSRLAAAKRAARALVDRLSAGAEVIVIEAGVSPRVTAPLSRDHSRASAAITAAQGHDVPSRLGEAVRTARALTADDPHAEIQVFTDGTHPPSEGNDLTDARVRWHGVGRRSDNVGITSFAIRKEYFSSFEYQAFLSLVNFSKTEKAFSLTLDLDGKTLAAKSLTLGPDVRRAMMVPFSNQGGGVVTARLDVADDLVADDVAYAVLPPPRKIAVLLVTPGNLFLEKELRTDPQVSLALRTPDAYGGGMEGFDVVVLDSVNPPRVGRGRYILVNSAPGDVPIQLLGRVERPSILDWDRGSPIMRNVDLAKVTVEDAVRMRPLAAGKALVESAAGPLVYALEEPDRKALFVGFDLFRTDLPLHVAFPLILSNALRWLHPAGLDQASLQLASGQPIVLPVEHGVTSATVLTPSGRRVSAQVVRGVLTFADTDEIGVYRILTVRGETRVAVNLMNADESNLTPRPLPGPAVAALAAAPPVLVERELWPLCVGFALLLLGIEGGLYWRRQTAGRLRPPAGRGDRWALALRAALLGVLLVALLRPTVPRWVDRLNVVFLLDQSDSVSLAARERAARFAEEAVRSKRGGDRAGLIVFGKEPLVDQSLSERGVLARPKAQVSGRATNLFQAIELGLASLPPGEANRLVLLSDGRQNEGDARAAAQAARDQGADIFSVPMSLTFTQEVVLESLLLPEEVKYGEPFEAKIVAWSERDTQGRLSLFRNGQFLGSQAVRLTAGKNVFAYRQTLEKSGIHVYQAGIEVDGDTIEDNNRTVGTVVVRGRPTVLLAEKDRAQAVSLASALRSQSIDVTVVEADQVPKDLAGLERYDGLILSNVSSLKLTKAQMANIRDYVRDYGGGLIMVGGDESFGLGGYYRTPVEEALPVTMEVKQKIEVPSLAVVLSIDRSGSMAMSTDEKVTKLDLAKEAAHLVVDLLNERNEVGVMSWDTEFLWDSPLRSAKDKAAIHRAIATIRAGGGTDGYPALKESYRVLYDSPAVLKHVIFLSDGQMTRGDFLGLLSRMAKDKITVSTIAIGTDADVQLMRDIAKWGKGRFYYTEDQQTLPRIFTLETQLASKAALVEQPFRPGVTAPGHEVLQDIDWKGAPPLGGYVATTLKRSADLLLMTHQEDPLLASWRYGLGRAVAFTSDAKAKWGVLWLRWRDFGKFWAQLARWTLKSGSRGDTVATVARRNGVGEVTIEAVDGKGDFINFLDAEVGVVTPSRQRTVVPLEQVAPGRYRGRFPAPQEGVYLVGVSERRGASMVGSHLAGLVVPYAPELRDLGVDETLLREVTEMTGGDILTSPRDAFQRARRRSRVAVDLWPWMLGFAAVMLVPDIALRRIKPGPLAGLFRRGRRRGRAAGR
jgi:Ca-activated chloride channel homolog